MKIFHKRPLSLILCIMLGGFCFFLLKSNVFYIIATATVLLFIVLSFVFHRLLRGRKILVRICLFALLISLILTTVFTNSFFPRSTGEESVPVYGNVIEADHTSPNVSTVTVRSSLVNGTRARHFIRITGDKETLSGVNIGDEISLSLILTDVREVEMTDYYVSRRISALGEEPSGVVIHSRGNYSLSHCFSLLRQSVSDRFKLISNKETGEFLSALIMGERGAIDPATNLNFRRTGLSHILALSGAHFVILTYAITFILKLLRLNPRLRTAISSVIIIGYMLITGMSPSVVRAGVMMLINSALFLLSERSDGVTSLSVSVFLILLFQPYAAFDISLWLSALATLGLIFLGTVFPTNPSDRPVKRLIRGALSALLASVFAISTSIIVSLFAFDSFSVLSVPATFLITPLVELLIYLGLFGLAFGGAVPVGKALTDITELIKRITKWMSDSDYALISYEYIPVVILSICLALSVFGFIVFADRKTAKPILLTVCGIFIALNVTGIICSAVTRNDDAIIFSPNGDSNTLVIRSEGEIALIQSRSSPFYAMRPDYVCREMKLTAIDKYIVAGYSAKTEYDLTALLSNIRTTELYLPSPKTEAEADIIRGIYQIAVSGDTKIILYNEMDAIDVGEAGYFQIYASASDITPRLQAFVLAVNGKIVTYVSPDAASNPNSEIKAAIDIADTLIIGGRRYPYSEPIFLIPESADEVIIGSEYYDTYEMELELKEKGVSVTVTDTPIKIFD